MVFGPVGQSVVKAFKRNGKHSYIVQLEHASQGSDQTFFHEDAELLWVQIGRASYRERV